MGKPATPTKAGGKPGTQVATAKTTALADAPPSDIAAMMGDYNGAGVSTDAADVGIPFLYILQDLSPQVKKRGEKYVDGAEIGMIFNNQSMELFAGEDGVLLIPCFFKKAQVEWISRDAGGGFVAEHPYNTPLLGQAERYDAKKPPRLKNGHDLVDTKYYFCLHAKPDGTYEAITVGLASSGQKVSRELQRLFKLVRDPRTNEIAASFLKAYRFKTKLAKNGANQEYWTWTITPERWVNSGELTAAAALHGDVSRGAVQASRPDEGVDTGGDADEDVL